MRALAATFLVRAASSMVSSSARSLAATASTAMRGGGLGHPRGRGTLPLFRDLIRTERNLLAVAYRGYPRVGNEIQGHGVFPLACRFILLPPTQSLSVGVATVSDPHDKNENPFIVYLGNDAIVADAVAPEIVIPASLHCSAELARIVHADQPDLQEIP